MQGTAMTQPWPGYGRASSAMARAAMARPWRGHGPAMARPLLGHGPQLATRNWRQRGVGRMRKAIEIRISSHRKNQSIQSVQKNNWREDEEVPGSTKHPKHPKHPKEQKVARTGATIQKAQSMPNSKPTKTSKRPTHPDDHAGRILPKHSKDKVKLPSVLLVLLLDR